MITDYPIITAENACLLMKKAITNNLNVLLIGAPGVGKTGSAVEVIENSGMKYKQFSVPTLDPWVDLTGLPKPVGTDDDLHIRFAQPEIIRDDVEILLFDEINRGHPKTMDALFEVTQFKSINGKRIKNLKMVWATMNPPGMGSLSNPIDPALEDRFDIKIYLNNEINQSYFSKKYGSDTTSMVASWYSALSEEMRLSITPRRIEKAMTAYKLGIHPSNIIGTSYGEALGVLLDNSKLTNGPSDDIRIPESWILDKISKFQSFEDFRDDPSVNLILDFLNIIEKNRQIGNDISKYIISTMGEFDRLDSSINICLPHHMSKNSEKLSVKAKRNVKRVLLLLQKDYYESLKVWNYVKDIQVMN